MELVYLWVEDYKNIKKQGFNFSPKFRCEYDCNTGELTVDKKKDFVSIFPNNINITAIVGENGSGKSSLVFDFIRNRRGFFIIKRDDELIVYFRNINIKTDLKKYKYKNDFYRNVLFYSMDRLDLAKTRSYLNVIDLQETNKLITENYLKLQEYTFELFDFSPYFLGYQFIEYWIDSEYDILETDIANVKSALSPNINTDAVIYLTLKALKELDDEYLKYLFNKFEEISQIFEHINLIDKLDPKHNYLIIKYEEVQKVLKNCDIDFIDEKTFNLLKDNKGKLLKIEELESIFGNEYIDLLFYQMIDELDFDFEGENGSSYGSLSHGEKTIYSFYVNLVNYNKEQFIMVLDEPDNTLHPNWQKKFIKEMIGISEKIKKKVHIIITAHSPFLLSDLPKENVIFLEKDEKTGNCINATDKVEMNPFGANIHTLLSHGFFMKDGLMGEFAKDKIDIAIKYLNQTKLSDDEITYCENIISIIGEPIIKRQLQKMLDSKRLKKIDEIDKIYDEIEFLKHRVESLRKNQ